MGSGLCTAADGKAAKAPSKPRKDLRDPADPRLKLGKFKDGRQIIDNRRGSAPDALRSPSSKGAGSPGKSPVKGHRRATMQERTFPDWNPHMSAEDREETERILAQAARKVHQAAPQQGDGNAPPFSESGLKITGHNREAGRAVAGGMWQRCSTCKQRHNPNIDCRRPRDPFLDNVASPTSPTSPVRRGSPAKDRSPNSPVKSPTSVASPGRSASRPGSMVLRKGADQTSPMKSGTSRRWSLTCDLDEVKAAIADGHAHVAAEIMNIDARQEEAAKKANKAVSRRSSLPNLAAGTQDAQDIKDVIRSSRGSTDGSRRGSLDNGGGSKPGSRGSSRSSSVEKRGSVVRRGSVEERSTGKASQFLEERRRRANDGGLASVEVPAIENVSLGDFGGSASYGSVMRRQALIQDNHRKAHTVKLRPRGCMLPDESDDEEPQPGSRRGSFG